MIVTCGRKGKNLMIDLGKTQPDFNTQFTNDGSFKAGLVFNCAEWRDPLNHMPFVKDDEKLADDEFDFAEYKMNESSTLIIVSTAENENEISAQLRKIPHG